MVATAPARQASPQVPKLSAQAPSYDPAWHRAFCDALERLHGVVPIAVIPDDDPWKLVLGRALDGLTGKIANLDVWYLLGLDPYERSMQEQRRLTEVMRVLGWRRKNIRHNAQRVGRGFRRGDSFMASPLGGRGKVANWRV